jgi:predicted DNA-binding ribbon-helix-helix protein
MSLVQNPAHRTISLESDTWKALEEVAAVNDMTRSAFIRRLVRLAVQEFQASKKKSAKQQVAQPRQRQPKVVLDARTF